IHRAGEARWQEDTDMTAERRSAPAGSVRLAAQERRNIQVAVAVVTEIGSGRLGSRLRAAVAAQAGSNARGLAVRAHHVVDRQAGGAVTLGLGVDQLHVRATRRLLGE